MSSVPSPLPAHMSLFNYRSAAATMQRYSGVIITVLGALIGLVVLCKVWEWWCKRRRNDSPETAPRTRGRPAVAERAREGALRLKEATGFSTEQLSLLGFTFKCDVETACYQLDQEGSRKECVVCLSEFNEGELLRSLHACSHTFHQECVDAWLRAHRSCPLCRTPLVLPEGEGVGAGDKGAPREEGAPDLRTTDSDSDSHSGEATQSGQMQEQQRIGGHFDQGVHSGVRSLSLIHGSDASESADHVTVRRD